MEESLRASTKQKKTTTTAAAKPDLGIGSYSL